MLFNMKFYSRKMLCLDGNVSFALTKLYEKSLNSSTSRNQWRVTRLNMNLFQFDRIEPTTISTVTTAATSTINDGGNSGSPDHDNTALLQRLISVIMQDIQQRNLNAKHSATASGAATTTDNYDGTAARTTSSLKDDGDRSTTAALYVPLNRSCTQRKFVEVCCVLFGTDDVETFRRDFRSVRILYETTITSPSSNDDCVGAINGGSFTAMWSESSGSRILPVERTFVYGTISRRALNAALLRFRYLPKLIFVSCKNSLYHGGSGRKNVGQLMRNGDLTDLLIRKLLYVANFVLYHSFHESERSFDTRRFGERHSYLRSMLFLLALVNAELLRANGGKNVNLSLNMQSLGKAYNDTGFHVFAENSIHHVIKVPNEGSSYGTNGITVNRYLGRVSELGVNAVSLAMDIVSSSYFVNAISKDTN